MASAQQSNDAGQYYKWYDRFTGEENSDLYNGIGYIEKYRVINEYHKFLDSTDFLPGTIIYKGQSYFGLKMKYDLDEDKVIISLNSGSGIVFLQPIKKWVDGFTINDHKFIHIREMPSKLEILPGFYEVLLETAVLKLLKKNRKKKFRRTKKSSVYYEFKSSNETILYFDKKYYRLNSRRDFIEIFPELKTDIKNYSKKLFRKSDRNDAMIPLLNRISVLLNPTE